MVDQKEQPKKAVPPHINEHINEKLKASHKRAWLAFSGLFVLFSIFLCMSFKLVNNFDSSLEQVSTTYDEKVVVIIDSLSAAGTKQKMYSGTFEERQDNFIRQAKGWLLKMQEEGSFYYMSNDDMDILLMTIYKYADLRMVDPRLPLAYIWGESWLNKNAKSASGARGLYQFMPSTARGYLGVDYYDGCEFDIVMSTRAWYAMHDVLKNEYYTVADDREREIWIANSYVGSLKKAKDAFVSGMSAEDYDNQWKDYHAGYATTMYERYEKLKDIVILN